MIITLINTKKNEFPAKYLVALVVYVYVVCNFNNQKRFGESFLILDGFPVNLSLVLWVHIFTFDRYEIKLVLECYWV